VLRENCVKPSPSTSGSASYVDGKSNVHSNMRYERPHRTKFVQRMCTRDVPRTDTAALITLCLNTHRPSTVHTHTRICTERSHTSSRARASARSTPSSLSHTDSNATGILPKRSGTWQRNDNKDSHTAAHTTRLRLRMYTACGYDDADHDDRTHHGDIVEAIRGLRVAI